MTDDARVPERRTEADDRATGPSSATTADRVATVDRRGFIRATGVAGLAAGIGVGLAACDDDVSGPVGPDAVDLGQGDFAVLNYAYALEQLEAAFYTRVAEDNEAGFSGDTLRVMQDLRAHEVVHRDLFAAALGGNAIPELEFDFSSVDLTDTTAVLDTAQSLEDTGVSAYNGAGRLLEDADFLVAAGKIVSVEARHAAAIRDIIADARGNVPATFFAGDDVVDGQGLDLVRTPTQVLGIAGTFIVNELDTSGLPSS